MFYLTYTFEILAMRTGLIFYKKIKPVVYRLIVPVLVLTVINEGLAHFGAYAKWNLPKNIPYSIFFIFQLLVFAIIYYRTYVGSIYKRIVAGITIASIAISIVFLSLHGIKRFDPFFLDAIAVGILLISCVYLYRIQSVERIYNLKKDALFWFSIALIIGNFFLLLFVNAMFVDEFRKDAASREVFSILNSIGNVFYYGCIIISILCSLQSTRRAGT